MINLYMNQTAIWKQKTGTNEYNEPSFAADATISCRIEYKNRMVRDTKGQRFISETTIYTLTAAQPDDVIVINGIDYPVLSVAQNADFDGNILFYEVSL